MRNGMVIGAALLLMAPLASQAQEGTPENVREARIWLDRGDEPVVQRGDRLRVYYRTSHDSYVAVFHIDTDGSVSLIHPTAPDEDHYIVGGRDYRLLFPRSPYWTVDEDPGMGYYFLVASPEPFDFAAFEYARYEHGWDLSRVGRAVYQDPYLAMDDYVAALIPDWEYVPYSLDFISYNVGSAHEYPRFMCYECHGFRSYTQWNPYSYACTDFRVVIWDDPYYYPVYRYAGTRVVYTTPLRNRPRFGFTTRVVGQPWAPVVRQRSAPPVRTAQYKEPAAARASGTQPTQRRATPSGVQASPRGASPSAASPSRASVRRPAGVQRRPSSAAAPSSYSRGGSTGTARPAAPRTTTSGRPTLQRRPSGTTAAPSRTSPSTSRSGTARPSTPSRSTIARPGSRGTTGVSPSRGSTRPSVTTRAPARSPTATRPSSTQSRPTVRQPTRAPTTRSSPTTRSRPAAQPQSRPTTTQTRPTVRPRSGTTSRGTASRPPVRRRGGGG